MERWIGAAHRGRKKILLGAATIPILGAITFATVGATDSFASDLIQPVVAVPAIVTAVAAPAAAPDLAVAAALKAFAPYVKKTSSNEALSAAFHAYFRYRAATPADNPYFYFVDLGLDNREARGFVFDVKKLRLVDGPFHVAHGRGSSVSRNGVPTKFSNLPGSNASSLGVYVAGPIYKFHGKSAGKSYSSVGLRMNGVSGEFNSAAMSRGIVAHGAPYVTSTGAGRSEGCPAVELSRAEKLLPLLANGGLVFIYSPVSEAWLRKDPWLQESIVDSR